MIVTSTHVENAIRVLRAFVESPTHERTSEAMVAMATLVRNFVDAEERVREELEAARACAMRLASISHEQGMCDEDTERVLSVWNSVRT